MKYHRGYRWSHGRIELSEAIDVEFDLTEFPLPRIRLYPDERGMLVGVSFGDRNGDPIVGADVRVYGRFGRRWADWLWKRRR